MKNLFFVAACVMAAIACSAAHAAEYSLDFSGVRVPVGERIVGFDITAKSAYVSSMQVIPNGWDITVDNEPSWIANVRGSILVGAAAIDLASLNKMLRITSDKAPGDVGVSGEVITTLDFEHEHHIALKPADVRLLGDSSMSFRGRQGGSN